MAACLCTLGIALFIIGLRVQRAWQERRERDFQQRWRPLLMLTMVGEPPAPLPPLPARDRWRFLKLWNHLQETVRGDASRKLSALARELNCQHMARRLLASSNITRRLFGILTLGHLRDADAWGTLQAQLRRRDRISSLYAARALIQIDPPRGAVAVVPQLLQREDWELVRVAILLQEFRDVLGGELTRHLTALAPQRLPRALQLAEALHLHLPAATLLPWLQSGQTAELLSAALRLAAGAEVLPAVRALAAHPDWRVRVQAARALGRLGEPDDVAVLTRLLSDPQWWVRYRAAGALANLPFLSRAQLRGLLSGLQDRYAREITHQVFAELMDAYL